MPSPHATATVVGNATVLLRIGPFTLLTDPNFLHRGERAALGYGLRSRRLTEPALRIDDLPPLDAVVLSHHHGDHFDDRAAEGLDDDLPIITTPHAARKLTRQGFRSTVALHRWEAHRLERDGEALQVTSLPARHGPLGVSALLPPVMGSMIEWSPEGGDRRLRLYITGDTVAFDGLAEIRTRYPDIECCLIHLGGTRILGLTLTMDAEQGVQALRTTEPAHAIPIHHSDYTVFASPVEDFLSAMEAPGSPPTSITSPAAGEEVPLPGWT